MRLIDADILEKQMYLETFEKDSDLQRWDSGCWIRYKLFENVISRQDTVDAMPVVHAHWIDLGNKNSDGTYNICCSACHDFHIKSKGHAMSYYTKAKYKFCGGCGACMDGEEVKE